MRIAFAGNPNSGKTTITMRPQAEMNASETGPVLRSKERKA